MKPSKVFNSVQELVDYLKQPEKPDYQSYIGKKFITKPRGFVWRCKNISVFEDGSVMIDTFICTWNFDECIWCTEEYGKTN